MKRSRLYYWTIVLIILDLATMGVIGGVYARIAYGNNDKAAATSRFGVQIMAPKNAFEKSYTSNDNQTVTVCTSNNENVLAPGTSSVMPAFSITGRTTTDIAIACDSEIVLTDWNVGNGETYCPIVVTIGDKTYQISEQYKTTDELANAIKTAIEEMYTHNYNKGTNMSSIKYNDISWKWDYENGDNDVNDTYLGNAELRNDNLARFEIKIALTITENVNSQELIDNEPHDNRPPQDNGSNDDDSDDDEPDYDEPRVDRPRDDRPGDNTTPPQTIGGQGQDEPGLTLSGNAGDTEGEIEGANTLDGSVNPKTGDDFSMILWVTLMVLALLLIVLMTILLIERGKRNQIDERIERKD